MVIFHYSPSFRLRARPPGQGVHDGDAEQLLSAARRHQGWRHRRGHVHQHCRVRWYDQNDRTELLSPTYFMPFKSNLIWHFDFILSR